MLISIQENDFLLNIQQSKQLHFENKFYLYKQNSTLWKKKYMNSMNMPETV